jgi:hypothetical protein
MPAEGLGATWRAASTVERGCYVLAAALAVSGVVHAAILVATGGSWAGPLSFRKPASFGVSFGLTLATITWTLGLRTRRPPAALLVPFALACATEVVVITVQAWRGLTSHFGVTGPGAGLVAGAAAGGAVVIVVTMTVATVLVCRPLPDVAPEMRLALRAGFASLLVALALGVYMLVRGVVISRVDPSGAGAFAFSAGIKPGHAATMHGVLVLPVLARLLGSADRPERFRLAVVRLAATGYGLLAGVVVVEVLAGIDPLAGTSIAGTVLAALGAAALLAAVGATVVSVTVGPGAVGSPRRARRS